MTTQEQTDGAPGERDDGDLPLRVQGLRVYYHTRRGPVKAVDGVSFDVAKGERLGLVGESGSGKSTIALALMRAHKPPAKIEAGKILLNGSDLLEDDEDTTRFRRLSEVAMVPQGALNSLNPVMRIRDQIIDGLKDHQVRLAKSEFNDTVANLLASVGLPAEVSTRFPHELSGGMKQRVAIAIAISMNPSLIIADEPTSALDVVVQKQVVQTLKEVQQRIGAAAIMIGHDMGLMAQFASRIGIMYGGKIVEIGPARSVLKDPKHPYSKMLISSLPDTRSKRKLLSIPGLPPSLLNPPTGCVFHPRCTEAMDICKREIPTEQPTQRIAPRFMPSVQQSEQRRRNTMTTVSTDREVDASEVPNDSQLLLADAVSKTYESGTFRKSYTHALDTVTLSVPLGASDDNGDCWRERQWENDASTHDTRTSAPKLRPRALPRRRHRNHESASAREIQTRGPGSVSGPIRVLQSLLQSRPRVADSNSALQAGGIPRRGARDHPQRVAHSWTAT